LTARHAAYGFAAMRFLAMAVPLLLALLTAGHAEVAGGGLADTDCRLVFRCHRDEREQRGGVPGRRSDV
jgi:hypothetical protein